MQGVRDQQVQEKLDNQSNKVAAGPAAAAHSMLERMLAMPMLARAVTM